MVRFETRRVNIRLQPGLCPGPRGVGGACSAPPDPVAAFGEENGEGEWKRAIGVERERNEALKFQRQIFRIFDHGELVSK